MSTLTRLHDPLCSDGTVALRPLSLNDALEVRAGRDDEIARWVPSFPGLPDAIAAWIEHSSDAWASGGPTFAFAIEADSALLGFAEAAVAPAIGVRAGDADVCLALLPAARGAGHGVRALELLCGFLRTRGVATVAMSVAAPNIAMQLCAERCGFAAVGSLITPAGDVFQRLARAV